MSRRPSRLDYFSRVHHPKCFPSLLFFLSHKLEKRHRVVPGLGRQTSLALPSRPHVLKHVGNMRTAQKGQDMPEMQNCPTNTGVAKGTPKSPVKVPVGGPPLKPSDDFFSIGSACDAHFLTRTAPHRSDLHNGPHNSGQQGS